MDNIRPITTDLRLFELQENLLPDSGSAQAKELFYNGELWLPSGQIHTITDPSDSMLVAALTRLYCLFNKHVQEWHPISFGESSFWVKLTDRCGRAYSGVRLIPKDNEWPVTEWSQCTDPNLFDEDAYFLFDRNIFDVNGAAVNVQGGTQPLVTRCWPSAAIEVDDIDDQSCLPQEVEDYINEAEESSSVFFIAKYNIDLGIPNECDSERHDLYA